MSDQSGAITPWRANILSPVYLVHTHMQPAARFASRCTCATAAQVHRASIAPPLPLFRPIARRQSYHSRRVSRHACESPPSLHIVLYTRARVWHRHVQRVTSVRNSPHETNATFLRIRPCKSVQFAASRGATRSLHCVVPRRASCVRSIALFAKSLSNEKKKRKRKKEEEEEVFYVCSKDKKVLWLR